MLAAARGKKKAATPKVDLSLHPRQRNPTSQQHSVVNILLAEKLVLYLRLAVPYHTILPPKHSFLVAVVFGCQPHAKVLGSAASPALSQPQPLGYSPF